jgi:uncharacterized delta-60 repeat protein
MSLKALTATLFLCLAALLSCGVEQTQSQKTDEESHFDSRTKLIEEEPANAVEIDNSGDRTVTTITFSGRVGGHFHDAAVQANGKIVAAGQGFRISRDFMLFRFNTDGTPDSTFNTRGRVATDLGTNETGRTLVIQTDGKFIFGGDQDGKRFVVNRYNEDGTLDTSWNTTGVHINTFPSTSFSVIAGQIKLQADGKAVFVGAGDNNFAISRYNTNGTLDTSFNTQGYKTVDIGGGQDDAYGVGVEQTNNKILVGGAAGADWSFIRLLSDGTLDATLSNDGIVDSAQLSGGGALYAISLQADGFIVVSGGLANDFGIMRFNYVGRVDTTFNTTGKRVENIGTSDTSYKASLLPDQRIVLGGIADLNFGLVRLLTSGALDTTFNTIGKLQYDFSGTDTGYGLSLQTDGGVILTGLTRFSTPPIISDWITLRFNSSGALDTTFNTSGVKLTSISIGRGYMRGFAIDTSGGIFCAGGAGSNDFGILKVIPYTGAVDTTFFTTGTNTANLSGTDIGYALLIDTLGRPVMAGSVNNINFGIARFLTSGALDTTFATDGASLGLDLSGTDYAYSVSLDPIGRIVMAGVSNNAIGDFGIARVSTNGALDTAFSTRGMLSNTFSGAERYYAVSVQTDGFILAAGSTLALTNFTIARLASNGTADTTFNTTGRLVQDISGTDVAYSLLIHANGKFLVTGSTNNLTDFIVARYNTNGTLDTTFNTIGRVITDISAVDTAYSASFDTLLGYMVVGAANGQFAAARYQSDGSLDNTFGTSGTRRWGIGDDLSAAYGVAINTATKETVIGGSSFKDDVDRFTIFQFSP